MEIISEAWRNIKMKKLTEDEKQDLKNLIYAAIGFALGWIFHVFVW